MRLDVLLVERGLVQSRELARRMIMAGEVTVDGQIVTKPGTRVASGAPISLKKKPRFVSRGGEKLAAALARFHIDPTGWVCADVGASTGGFTDCLLRARASRVYAIDVGYGQLAWTLRQDPRVVVMERVNARHLTVLPEPIHLVTMDVSFISVRHILSVSRGWVLPEGQAVILIKPQFEAGRSDVGKGGVVRDPEVHRRVLEATMREAMSADFYVWGLMPSPILGPAGNIEFLLWLGQTPPTPVADLNALARAVVSEANAAPSSGSTVPGEE
jgi:23S rRNA (cytidine1920-2'-O)/16S rRNA (cytidine1409-2'-O)-methyltransferase